MDIKHLKIKKKVEKAYKKIKKFEKKLVDLREKCKHSEVKTANFMWAPGHTTITKVCAICGKPMPTNPLKMDEDSDTILISSDPCTRERPKE